MNRWFLTFLCLFIFQFNSLFANPVDSLRNIFLQKTEESVEAGIQICDYFETVSSDSMLHYAEQTVSLAQNLNFPDKEALAYRKMADAYYYLNMLNESNLALQKAATISENSNNDLNFIGACYNDIGYNMSVLGLFPEALKYHEKALQFFIKSNNLKEQAYAYSNLAVAYFKFTNYQKAIDNYLKAYAIDTLIHDLEGEGTSLNNLGRVFIELKKYDTGIEYYQKSLAIAVKQENKYLQAIRNNNIGMALQLKGDYDGAISYFNIALELDKETENEKAFATRHNNMALAYQQKNDNVKAHHHFLKAMEFYEKYNDIYNLGKVYANLGMLLFEQNDLNNAYSYLSKAFEISKQYQSLTLRKKAVGGLYKIEKSKNNFKIANRWLELLSETRDSILMLDVLKYAEELEKVYKTNQKEAQIKELEKDQELKNLQLEHRKQQRNLASIIAILAIASALILLFMQKKLSIKNLQLAALNQTLNKLFSIISHDIKSAVAAYQSSGKLISHYLKSNQSDKLQLIAGELTINSNRLSFMLENLLNWSLSNLKNYDPQKSNINLFDIAQKVIELYEIQASTKNVMLINNIDKQTTAYADEQNVHLIIRNLLSNAIKFTQNGKVILSSLKSDDFISVTIEDTGVGMDKETIKQLFEFNKNNIKKGTHEETGSGLGLFLVKEFIEKNNGTIEVFSDIGKGTIFKFKLPCSN